MKRTFLLLIVALTIAACRDGQPQDKPILSPLCGSVSGFTVSYFAYGEGKMLILPLSKVRPETVFVIGLKPLDGFGTADVTITGTSANASWINATGQHDSLSGGPYPDGALEVGCVPSDPVGTSYKFKLEVKKAGVTNTLDPRAEIVGK